MRYGIPCDDSLSIGIGKLHITATDYHFEIMIDTFSSFPFRQKGNRNIRYEFDDDDCRHVACSIVNFTILLLCITHFICDQFECIPCIPIKLVFIYHRTTTKSTNDFGLFANQTQFYRLRHNWLFIGSVSYGIFFYAKFIFVKCSFFFSFLDCERSGFVCHRNEKILRLNHANSIDVLTYYLLVCATKTETIRNLMEQEMGKGEGGRREREKQKNRNDFCA